MKERHRVQLRIERALVSGLISPNQPMTEALDRALPLAQRGVGRLAAKASRTIDERARLQLGQALASLANATRTTQRAAQIRTHGFDLQP